MIIASKSALTQAARQGLSARIRFARANMILKFGLLLFESSVSCLSEAQLFLDDTEYMLHFCPDRRLRVLCFFGGVPLTLTQFLYL